jgi:transposase
MEAIVERVAGVDVGQATVVATALVGAAHERARKETRTFRTVTRDLLALREWLLAKEVTHVALEGTGIYWRPVYEVLEDAFEMILGNAHHIKNVPGRKTDVKDSEWLADLARHGLIAKSFVPPKPFRRLRELLRYRRKLLESRTAERNRLLKLLETANIKLASVASNVFGVSGRLMLQALIEGAATPSAMAALAQGRLRTKVAELEHALEGRLGEHHRFLLQLQLRRLDHGDADLASLDARIDEALLPYRAPCEVLQQIPGVSRVVAAVIVAEDRHDRLPQRAARGGVGRRLSGQQRKRRQTYARGRPEGQRASTHGPRRSGRRGISYEGQLSPGQVLPPPGPPGHQAGRDGDRPQDPHRRLPPTGDGRPLPRSRPHVLGRTGQAPHHADPRPSARTARLRRHHRAEGRVTATRFS